MRSMEAKRGWSRGKKCWISGPQRMAIFGFFLCVKTFSVMGEDNVCVSDACKWTASVFRKNMDPTVDPCTDFYKFACGGFLNSTVIPAYQSSVGHIEMLIDEVRENLTHTLASDIKPNEPKFYKLAKKLYKSCMNPVSSGAQGLRALNQFLSKLGGWPVVDGETWDDSKFDWRQMIYKFHYDGNDDDDWGIGTGIGHLIGCRVRNVRPPSKKTIMLGQPSGLLPLEVQEDNLNETLSILQEYHDFLVNLAVELGADRHRALTEVAETLSFEIQLANIKSSPEKSTILGLRTIGELNKQFTSVPWMKYIRKCVPSNINITEDEIIYVKNPQYYVKLEELMSNTSKRVQANYVFSRVAIRNAVYSSEQMRRSVYNNIASRYHIQLDLNRTKWCTAQIEQYLKFSISGIYAREYFDEEARNRVVEMVMGIKRKANNKWLQSTLTDFKTKQVGYVKSKNLVYYVGYPTEILDDKKLDDHYENLEFNENDFFGNMNNLSIFDLAIGFKQLREPSMNSDWRNRWSSTTVNAAYSPSENSIEIFAAFLHGLNFDKDRPNYLNYGAIGFMIGHEITHSFYERAEYFDENKNRTYLWDPLKRMNFQERSQCIIEQYENYVDDDTGLHYDGTVTLSENIADIGGIRLAYDAYKQWAAENVPEAKLPGFEKYSAAQMFWLSKASVGCTKYDIETLKNETATEVHAIDRLRVIVPMSNMPEFSEDFQCQINSPMNPPKKCIVW